MLPPAAASALASLGEHLAIARLRRKESQRQWAQRLGVSIPTLVRMERGDPSVSIGIYATALWMLGLSDAFGAMASPDKDLRALEVDVNAARRTRAVRRRVSVAAQLAKSREKP
jgi:transcriptional regulator with XRE-family HTH domain